jgi:hypothetical protein
MREYLRHEFGIVFSHEVRLEFTGKDRLNSLVGQPSGEKRTLGLFCRFVPTDEYVIYLLSGLPRTDFQAVTAHEYTHAWQSENCPPDQELILIEGFASWIEYQVYRKFGGMAGAKRIEESEDPIYGKGYREVREIAKEQGFVGLIRYVKTRTA